MLELLQSYPIAGYSTAAAVFAVYIFLLRSEKYWVWLEIFLGSCYIASLPFSNYLLSTWLGGDKGDLLSRNLFILTMLGMITQGLAFYFTKDIEDRVVRSSLTISNILARGGLLFSAAYALLYVEGFNPLALRFDCIFLSLLLLGDLAQLRKSSTKDGCLALGERLQYCAAIDAFASFVAGLFLLGFPGGTAGFFARSVQVTSIHEMFAKSFGFQMIASSILSFACLCYKRPMDTSFILRAKFAIYVPVVLASFWYCITSEPGPTNWGCVLAGMVSLFLGLNSVVAQIDTSQIDPDRIKFD